MCSTGQSMDESVLTRTFEMLVERLSSLEAQNALVLDGFHVDEVVALDGLEGARVIRTASQASEVIRCDAPDVLVYDLDAMGYNKAFERAFMSAGRMKKCVLVASLGRVGGAIASCADALLFHPRTCAMVVHDDPNAILCLRTDPGQGWCTL